MLSGKNEQAVTVESVATELADIEARHKARRKTLRALLAALKAERGWVEEGGDE